MRQRYHLSTARDWIPSLEHVIAEGERGEMTHAYAVANFVNGGYAFEVWPVHQIVEHAKKFSKSYYKIDYKTKQQVVNPNSAWMTHFESMAKKTMVMAIWKYLPLETELLLAGAQDETTVRDLSRLEDEHSVINIMPERDEVEALPAERPAPEPKATTKGKAVVMSDPEPGTENETDKPEEMGRMSDDMFILQTAVIDINGRCRAWDTTTRRRRHSSGIFLKRHPISRSRTYTA